MTKIFDVHQKAQVLREKHQNDIEEKLQADMNQALDDTKAFVQKKVSIMQNDLDQKIEQTQQSLLNSFLDTQHNLENGLQRKRTTIEMNIEKMVNSLSQTAKEVNTELQQTITDIQQNLQQLNVLNQAVADQALLKRVLFSSNIVLISIALILLISSICFAYVSKSKFNDIGEMQKKVNYLREQGGSMNIIQCRHGEKMKLCVQIDPTAPHYMNDFMAIREIN